MARRRPTIPLHQGRCHIARSYTAKPEGKVIVAQLLRQLAGPAVVRMRAACVLCRSQVLTLAEHAVAHEPRSSDGYNTCWRLWTGLCNEPSSLGKNQAT